MTGGGPTILEVRNSLDLNANNLAELIEAYEQWLDNSSEAGEDIREKAEDLIYIIRNEIVFIIRNIGEDSKDEHLSKVAASVALRSMQLVSTALNSNNQDALMFAIELTSLLFLLKPYMDERTTRYYGGELVKSANLCNTKIATARKGVMEADLIPLYMSIYGFYSSYMRT